MLADLSLCWSHKSYYRFCSAPAHFLFIFVLPEFLVAVRAMEILAVLFGATCIILTGLWSFLKIEKYRNIVAIAYLITGFLAGKKLEPRIL